MTFDTYNSLPPQEQLILLNEWRALSIEVLHHHATPEMHKRYIQLQSIFCASGYQEYHRLRLHEVQSTHGNIHDEV